MLIDIGIIRNNTKSSKIFDTCCWEFYTKHLSPTNYVISCWTAYTQSHTRRNNALNGSIFELIIASVCTKNGIMPMFLQASVAFVPNIIYDIIFYTSAQFPICLSLKTSLRERYKQADLEAVALKYVHRNAESYLISLDSHEVIDLKSKIRSGSLLGIDDVIDAQSDDFCKLMNKLKGMKMIKPEKIDIITANNVVA